MPAAFSVWQTPQPVETKTCLAGGDVHAGVRAFVVKVPFMPLLGVAGDGRGVGERACLA